MRCSVLQRVAACCSVAVLQCHTCLPLSHMFCSVLQCVAACCSVLQCCSVAGENDVYERLVSLVLQCVVVCCSVLQCR